MDVILWLGITNVVGERIYKNTVSKRSQSSSDRVHQPPFSCRTFSQSRSTQQGARFPSVVLIGEKICCED